MGTPNNHNNPYFMTVSWSWAPAPVKPVATTADEAGSGMFPRTRHSTAATERYEVRRPKKMNRPPAMMPAAPRRKYHIV